ncbi:MAG: PsbP-related protein [bacterium]|jgi:ketosteroid isomerase-like protein
MKKFWLLFAVFTFLSGAASFSAEGQDLQAQVKALFERYDQAIEQENLVDLMDCFSTDFMAVFAGSNREQLQNQMQTHFQDYEELQVERNIIMVKSTQPFDMAISQMSLKGRAKDATEAKELFNTHFVDFLQESDGQLKIQAKAVIDEKRLEKLEAKTYEDQHIGYSFNAPEDWYLIPSFISVLSDVVLFLAPDGSSSGMFGMIELPYNADAKTAVVGDDAMAKQIAERFNLITEGEITVNGISGYQSETEFLIKEDGRERKRWRVALMSGGLVYVLVLDAIPPSQWDQLMPAFQSIVNSFTLTESGKAEGAQRLRQRSAQGEVVGNIYSSSEFGFQVAAPGDWTVETTKYGNLDAVVIKPTSGKHLVRILPVKHQTPVNLDEVVKAQMESIGKLTQSVKSEPVQDTQLAGLPAKSFIQEFSVEGLGAMKRNSVFLKTDDMLYMIFCDAVPPEEYPQLEDEFNEILQSFTLN